MAELLKVPHQNLAPETVNALIEAFVLQNGTDYGAEEVSLTARVGQVQRQLEKGEVHIVFHAESESCTLVTERALRMKTPSGE